MPQSTKGLSSPFPAAVPVQWLWGWHLQVAQAVASVHPAPTGTPRALGTGRNQRPQTHGPVRLSCTLPVSQQPLPCVLSHSQEKGLAGGKSCCSGMAGTEQPLFGFHFLEKQTLGGFTLHGRMPQSAGLGSAEGNEPEAGPRLHPSCELRCSPATTAPEHVPWEQHGSGICQSPCNKESRGGKTQMPRTCLHGSGCLGIASVLQNEGKKKKLLSVIQENLPLRSGPGGEVSHQTKQLRVSEPSWLAVTPSGWAAQALPHFSTVCEVSLKYCSLGICFCYVADVSEITTSISLARQHLTLEETPPCASITHQVLSEPCGRVRIYIREREQKKSAAINLPPQPVGGFAPCM